MVDASAGSDAEQNGPLYSRSPIEAMVDILAWLRKKGINALHVRVRNGFWEAGLGELQGEPSVWRRVVDLLDEVEAEAA